MEVVLITGISSCQAAVCLLRRNNDARYSQDSRQDITTPELSTGSNIRPLLAHKRWGFRNSETRPKVKRNINGQLRGG